MPTTFTNLVPVRRVAVGDCLGPQGRDGTDELTRTAFEALKSAAWTENPASPSLPVHEYDRAMPSGDAWKACYGYSASTRTQRAACGAVCYSFALPADATASGNVANVTKIALSCTGDRYLDAGADLHLLLSDSATPPTCAEWLQGPSGEIVVAELCKTSTQTAKPNDRHGETDAVSIEPQTPPAAKAFLHIALLLHDYLATREGWIEGGSMLDGARAEITFSRDVAADAIPGARLLLVTAGYTGLPNFANIKYAESFLSVNYNTFSPTALVWADIETMFRLAYAGRCTDITSAWAFTAANERGRGAASVNTEISNPWYANVVCRAHAFHTDPNLVPGLFVAAPTITNSGDAGTIRVALVQHDSVAAVGDNESTALSNLPAFAEVFAGGGPNVIAYAESAIAAGGSVAPSLPVLRTPTKPYISLVVLPSSIGIDAGVYPVGVLVASPSI